MTQPPICFLRGTHVRTCNGETRVEDLSIGDRVATHRGYALPIKWIGRQTFKNTAARWHDSVLPVRISRDAIDDGVPHRDLYVSPAHRLYLDSCLIEAKSLINGKSVVQALPDGVNEIHYYHLEFERHEVIFAEEAPAESFQLISGREHFDNFVEYERLYGVDKCGRMRPYAFVVGRISRRWRVKELLRGALAPIMDVRDQAQVVRDRIAARSTRFDQASLRVNESAS